MKILIVDDEPIFRDLLMQVLQSDGYDDLQFAESGNQALDVISQSQAPFDCFFLDVNMDGMSGIDLCASIRNKPGYDKTPIVMISSMTDRQYVDAAFDAGASDYINKPVDAMEVKARMRMVEALASERRQYSQISSQLTETEQAFGKTHGFEDADIIADSSFLIPSSSLENYVLRMGGVRLMTTVAVGFHVRNVDDIFVHSSGLEFADTMAEVARSIGESLHGGLRVLSYFGSGNFCALVSRMARLDSDTLETDIGWKISQVAGLLSDDAALVPSVAVGAPKSSGLSLFRDPTAMLFAAMQSAQDAGTHRHEAIRIKGAIHVA